MPIPPNDVVSPGLRVTRRTQPCPAGKPHLRVRAHGTVAIDPVGSCAEGDTSDTEETWELRASVAKR